jgi:type I restriction enzyme M protein
MPEQSQEAELNHPAIVDKICDHCRVMQSDGMDYGDYLEQLTYLLFLKTAHERTRPPYNQPSPIPEKFAWPSLVAKSGEELAEHYRSVLQHLGAVKGMVGLIFGNAQNKFGDPAKLKTVIVDLVDREDWSAMNARVRGEQKDAESGAMQYVSPRALMRVLMDCVGCRKKA